MRAVPPAWSDASLARARSVRLLGLDVDGVMTDGGIVLTSGGDESKRFDVRDGLGLRLLLDAGVVVGIITGRSSGVVARRGAELGLAFVHQGVTDKWSCLEAEIQARGIAVGACAYMGDDLPDLPLLLRVGLGAAPADAHWEVRRRVDWVSDRAGGRGAVRQLCEGILVAQGRWEGVLRRLTGEGAGCAVR
ncbi:MAG: hypothetical protein HQL59_08285 [Magnetococcales bacterium]|nr:hypothetical protein [Magnetococcales bacterium]